MKSFKVSFVVSLFTSAIFFFAGCNTKKKLIEQNDLSVTTDSWTLVFEDEFDNLSSWNIWYGGAFNNEIQLYREEQLSIADGVLTISASRETVKGPNKPFDQTPRNFEYVSGRIESKQLYGPSDRDGERAYRVMARLKLPSGHGMWPAFWTYGDPWPTQGEIDILEARGSEPNTFSSNIFYGPKAGVSINKHTEVKHAIGEQNLTKDFHIYEMIWRANSIDILFDNKLIHTYKANSNNNISELFGKKQKIVFNTAVGGWYFSDTNFSNFADSSTMQVDWVRVYKK